MAGAGRARRCGAGPVAVGRRWRDPPRERWGISPERLAAAANTPELIAYRRTIELGVADRARRQWPPELRAATQGARAQDVGVRYAVAPVAGLLAGRVPRRLRPWYVVGLLATTVVPVLLDADFTDVGHLTAVLLGFALAVLVTRAAAGRT